MGVRCTGGGVTAASSGLQFKEGEFDPGTSEEDSGGNREWLLHVHTLRKGRGAGGTLFSHSDSYSPSVSSVCFLLPATSLPVLLDRGFST